MCVPVMWCALDTVEYTLTDTFPTSPGEGSPLSPRTGYVSLRQDAWLSQAAIPAPPLM